MRQPPHKSIHGRPTRTDYDTLKTDACALASEVEDITYTWSKSATDDFGLLGDILGINEYDDLTSIDTYAILEEPASYDPTINNATLIHKRKRKEEDWDLIRTSWFIRKGFLRGIVDNLHYALDKQYYLQLKHCLTAYRKVTPFQILEHLNDQWCPLDGKAKKALKDTFYTKWDGDEHLTAFGKRLDDEQKALVRSDITITDKDKLQLYLEEMYGSNHFDKNKMPNWEKKSTAVRSNYNNAKTYFEDLVKATDTYEQNAGGGTTSRSKYESANQLADCGNDIRDYIAKIASAAAANSDHAANTQAKNTQFEAISAQIKALTEAVAKLTAKKSSAEQDSENVNPNTHGKNRENSGRTSSKPQMETLCNMGAYCHFHGFHPVGHNHNSKTYTRKLDGHKDNATWTNRMEGNMYWPIAKRVAIEQQNNATWKGMAPPTN